MPSMLSNRVLQRRNSEALACPVCDEDKYAYLFVIRGLPIVRCPGCGLIFTHPQPAVSDFPSFYDNEIGSLDPRILWSDTNTEREAAKEYFSQLEKMGVKGGEILLVAPLDHVLASEARARGFKVGKHMSICEFESGTHIGEGFDAAIVAYQMEKSVLPQELLRKIHSVLKEDGVLLLAAISLDSWSARFFGSQWTGWRPENRYYFNNTTIQSILWKSGFMKLVIKPDRRAYTIQHLYERARGFPQTLLTRAIIAMYRVMPHFLRNFRLHLATSGILITARRRKKLGRPLCSIIMPVYNESRTFPILMEALLTKQIPGMDKEIILVESNSTDGSRDLVLAYRENPQVKVILQSSPKGKGNAVREGFKHAGGDIILIQDADLEYDLNDYEELLQPIGQFKAPFVLGARHGPSWKMRKFGDQLPLAIIMNLAGLFFVKLINVLYKQHMKDPFTMYKIFRQDCLYGLRFECNRFDFDHELVIKLVRKGYTPLEIPVNYTSRSFKEGKKIKLFRDGLGGLQAEFKYRFAPIGIRRR